VSFCYPKQQRIFRNVSLDIAAGERIGFYGANGTGKTTLAKLMAGILKPDSGTIYIEGQDISKLTLADIGKRVGYIFQNPDKQLFTSTVYDAVAFGLRYQKKPEDEVTVIVRHWLEYFGLQGLEDRFPIKLSMGQKQRLVLAATLARGADFFILDEPASGLDGYNEKLLSQCLLELTKLNKGYIIISHDWDFIKEHTSRIFRFREVGVIEDAGS